MMFYQLLNINIFIFKLKNFNIHQFIFSISPEGEKMPT